MLMEYWDINYPWISNKVQQKLESSHVYNMDASYI